MSIWFQLHINDTKIADVSAIRTSGDDTSGWCEYDWKVERLQAMRHPVLMGVDERQTVTGNLKHRYAAGGLKLMSAVLEAYHRDCAQYEFDNKHVNNGY